MGEVVEGVTALLRRNGLPPKEGRAPEGGLPPRSGCWAGGTGCAVAQAPRPMQLGPHETRPRPIRAPESAVGDRRGLADNREEERGISGGRGPAR